VPRRCAPLGSHARCYAIRSLPIFDLSHGKDDCRPACSAWATSSPVRSIISGALASAQASRPLGERHGGRRRWNGLIGIVDAVLNEAAQEAAAACSGWWQPSMREQGG
jgi:hypothetical protein